MGSKPAATPTPGSVQVITKNPTVNNTVVIVQDQPQDVVHEVIVVEEAPRTEVVVIENAPRIDVVTTTVITHEAPVEVITEEVVVV